MAGAQRALHAVGSLSFLRAGSGNQAVPFDEAVQAIRSEALGRGETAEV